jgi:hypothetical protein
MRMSDRRQLTGVTRHTTGRASRGEEDEDITEELDVGLEVRMLLLGELLVARVERDPGGR